MPNLNGHLAVVAAASGAALYFQVIPEAFLSPALGTGILIGTLLPDLDHQSSTVNQKLLAINKKWFQILIYGAFSTAMVYYMGTEFKVLLAAAIIFLTGSLPHRAFTHKPIGVLLICSALYLFLGLSALSAGIMAGMIVHIGADKVNDWLF